MTGRIAEFVEAHGRAVALIVLLAVRSQLPGQDRWWIWVAVAGVGVGLFGLWYTPRLKRSRARAAQRRAARLAGNQAAAAATITSTMETPLNTRGSPAGTS